MRILIFGGNGMIGHKMHQIISEKHSDTWVTLRNSLDNYKFSTIYKSEKVLDKIDLSDFSTLKSKLDNISPDVLINASGVTIRRGVNNNITNSIILNSALPHFLNEWVVLNRKRLIHFSTDCVFSGKKGDYNETDFKDAFDLYGLTKSLGEVFDSKNTLTLRGSMIGRELENKTELLEWFLKQGHHHLKGFSKVLYSGITNIRMAKIVLNIIENYPIMYGLYNISSQPISKYTLLKLFNKAFDVNAEIEMENTYESNKNLISNRIFNELKIEQPNWNELVNELKIDSLKNSNIYN